MVCGAIFQGPICLQMGAASPGLCAQPPLYPTLFHSVVGRPGRIGFRACASGLAAGRTTVDGPQCPGKVRVPWGTREETGVPERRWPRSDGYRTLSRRPVTVLCVRTEAGHAPCTGGTHALVHTSTVPGRARWSLLVSSAGSGTGSCTDLRS